MKRTVGGLLLACLIGLGQAAWAGPAQDTLKSDVDAVLSILRSTQAGDPGRTERLAKAMESFFEAKELARRTLALNWTKFSPQEQDSFTQAFVQLLENTYVRRIETYTNEQVVYLSESPLGEDQVEVSTKIVAAQKEVPIAYRLIKDSGTWKVYDVVIEGVSLVQNYRSQFEQILTQESPAQLIERVKKIDAEGPRGNQK